MAHTSLEPELTAPGKISLPTRLRLKTFSFFPSNSCFFKQQGALPPTLPGVFMPS
jgi:hypothetical protein